MAAWVAPAISAGISLLGAFFGGNDMDELQERSFKKAEGIYDTMAGWRSNITNDILAGFNLSTFGDLGPLTDFLNEHRTLRAHSKAASGYLSLAAGSDRAASEERGRNASAWGSLGKNLAWLADSIDW